MVFKGEVSACLGSELLMFPCLGGVAGEGTKAELDGGGLASEEGSVGKKEPELGPCLGWHRKGVGLTPGMAGTVTDSRLRGLGSSVLACTLLARVGTPPRQTVALLGSSPRLSRANAGASPRLMSSKALDVLSIWPPRTSACKAYSKMPPKHVWNQQS